MTLPQRGSAAEHIACSEQLAARLCWPNLSNSLLLDDPHKQELFILLACCGSTRLNSQIPRTGTEVADDLETPMTLKLSRFRCTRFKKHGAWSANKLEVHHTQKQAGVVPDSV